jgi:hypothetical protein
MSKKTTAAAQAKGNVKSAVKAKKPVVTKKKVAATKKVASKKAAPVEATLTATVEFRSCVTGEYVTRTYEVTKADINDVDWYGGDCDDNFFNDFETNEERFKARLEDWVHYLLWQSDDSGNPLDPDLNGNHPDGLESNSFAELSWYSDFEVQDFYPV